VLIARKGREKEKEGKKSVSRRGGCGQKPTEKGERLRPALRERMQLRGRVPLKKKGSSLADYPIVKKC